MSITIKNIKQNKTIKLKFKYGEKVYFEERLFGYTEFIIKGYNISILKNSIQILYIIESTYTKIDNRLINNKVLATELLNKKEYLRIVNKEITK